MRLNRTFAVKSLLASLLVCAAIGFGGCNKLRESEAEITESLTIETPLGTPKTEVRNVLVASGRGPIAEEGNSRAVSLKEPFKSREWRSLFRVHLGSYGIAGTDLIRTDVIAFYVFDSGGSLVEISVVKEHDSL